MHEWIPVSSSPKGRLALAAVREFGARPFGDVTVGELSAAAQVTTGALYHHFGSKLGMYAFVRDDVERRLLDRMEGALAVAGDVGDRSGAVRAAMLVGFDFAVREGFLYLLGTPPPGVDHDPLADLMGSQVVPRSQALGRILAAAWRAALGAVADGAEPRTARAALQSLEVRIPS